MTIEDERMCRRCGLSRPLSCFRITTRGHSYRCLECEALPPLTQSERSKRTRLKDPERTKQSDRKQNLARHHMTPEQFDAMLAAQGGGCAVCGNEVEPGKRGPFGVLCVDHDHKCCAGTHSCGKCIRGLLCTPCNVVAAWFEEYGWLGVIKLEAYLTGS